MFERFIHWLISKYYPEFILIPKDNYPIPVIKDDDPTALIPSDLYDKVLSLARHIESSGSLGEFKRINVITAIKAERRQLDLPQYSKRDINLAIELAIRNL